MFYIDDANDPTWRVVLRHDPRSRRVEGDREVIVFGATGSVRPTLSTRSRAPQGSSRGPSTSQVEREEEVPVEQVNALLRDEENLDDEEHMNDMQYE